MSHSREDAEHIWKNSVWGISILLFFWAVSKSLISWGGSRAGDVTKDTNYTREIWEATQSRLGCSCPDLLGSPQLYEIPTFRVWYSFSVVDTVFSIFQQSYYNYSSSCVLIAFRTHYERTCVRSIFLESLSRTRPRPKWVCSPEVSTV